MTNGDSIKATAFKNMDSILRHFTSEECIIDISPFYKKSDNISEELYNQWQDKIDLGGAIDMNLKKTGDLPTLFTYDINIALLINHEDQILKPLKNGPEPFLRIEHFKTGYYSGLHSGYLSSKDEDKILGHALIEPNYKQRIEYFNTLYNTIDINTNFGNFIGYKFVKKFSPTICSPGTMFWLGYYTAKTWCIEDVAKLKPIAFIDIINVSDKNNVQYSKVPKSFLDFFLTNIGDVKIQSIKEHFKDYTGKKLAGLIFILQSELQILDIRENSNTQSRKHFVCGLKEISDFKMQSVNKCFESGSMNFRYRKDDPELISIRNKLAQLDIKPVV